MTKSSLILALKFLGYRMNKLSEISFMKDTDSIYFREPNSDNFGTITNTHVKYMPENQIKIQPLSEMSYDDYYQKAIEKHGEKKNDSR